MSSTTRILWVLFVASAVTVAILVARESRAPPGSEPTRAGAGVDPRTPEPRQAGSTAAGIQGQFDPPSAAPGAKPDDGPGDVESAAEEDAGGEPSSRGPTENPTEFLESVLKLAEEGALEDLTARMRPGAIRTLKETLIRLLWGGEEARKELAERTARSEFVLTETPEGLLKVGVVEPSGAELGLDLFLVPKDGGWELASSSDLAPAAADAERAKARLQLLAICQSTFLVEDLDGDGPDYAASAAELARGLDRSEAYEGVLEPKFVAAADAGRPIDGYVFGRVSGPAGDAGYYAVPVVPGSGPRETLLIDQRGGIWAQDLQGGPPPSEWPGPDPSAKGWKKMEVPPF